MITAALVLALLPWLLRRHEPRAAPWVRPTRAAPPPRITDTAVLLDLADAALSSGASIPTTVQGLGRAVPQPAVSRGLGEAGNLLLLGTPWQAAWQTCPAAVQELADALEPAWCHGADPGPLLRQAALSIRADRQRQAHEAAARLGVRLVLPLGLCLLPAFVLLALVPTLLSGGAQLLGG